MTVETAALPPLAARLRGVRSSPVRDILALTQQPGVISFAGGLPAPELFDGPGTRAAFAAALHDAAVGRTLQYSTTEGDPALRAAVAARLTARGLPTHADELLITSGSQQALTLIATVLLEPGDTVLVEEPSYLAALQAFQLAGATVVPVPCDDDGIDPEAAAALAARHGARLLYTIPTFQNPTGRTLPLERREALVALARGAGFWLLEDDPYGELRYRGEPLPTLAALDDRVLSLSTLSKIAAPGLRIGWVRAPEPLRRPLTIAKQAADLHSSTVDQAAAAHWLETIDLDARVATLRSRLRRAPRRADRRARATRSRPGRPTTGPTAGCSSGRGCPTAGTRPSCSTARCATTSRSCRAIRSSPGRPIGAALRLSFTAHAPAEIAEGLAGCAPPGPARRASKPSRSRCSAIRTASSTGSAIRSASASRARLRRPSRAKRSARPVSAQKATSCAQWRRTRSGHGSAWAERRASSRTVRPLPPSPTNQRVGDEQTAAVTPARRSSSTPSTASSSGWRAARVEDPVEPQHGRVEPVSGWTSRSRSSTVPRRCARSGPAIAATPNRRRDASSRRARAAPASTGQNSAASDSRSSPVSVHGPSASSVKGVSASIWSTGCRSISDRGSRC